MATEGRDRLEPDRTATTDDDEDVGLAHRPLLRRGFLRAGTAAAAAVGLTAAVGTASAAGDIDVMSDPSPANLQVGGGETYRRHVRLGDADYNCWNKGMFLDALEDASSGDVVHVANDSQIDLTGESNLTVDDGVTIASGRGRNGKPGGLVYTDDYPGSLFKIYSDDVRVTGLRIRGPRRGYFDPSSFDPYESMGVWFLGEDSEMDNCQAFGWPMAAVGVGSRSRAYGAHLHHNSLHNNAMEGYGYGAVLYNGHSLVEHNYFGFNRHAVTGFGHETNGYEARYNLVGPRTVSHAFDMHGLNQNLDTGSRLAGKRVDIHHNTFQFTDDILDRAQEAITIRGIPEEAVTIRKNWFRHAEQPDDEDVGENGQAYRQYNTGEDSWKRVYSTGNHFGPELPVSDVGHERAPHVRGAKAMDAFNGGGTKSGLRFPYWNRFDQRMRVTDVGIDPASKKIASLEDGSLGEGMWRSEVHVLADVQNGGCDVGGGRSLPGTIDIDSDGHSASPDREPILSPGSKAAFRFYEFVDRNGRSVDMRGERVNFAFSYRLADGTEGVDEFTVTP